MKKRILCVMLTLIMLVSLVPSAAISASAASLKISEPAITVLKKMTTFKKSCYRVADTQDFRIGYGTPCTGDHVIYADGRIEYSGDENKPHTITEKKADKELRKLLGEMDKKVNSFASSNKLSLKQCQHDALVVFSYNVGTAWMNGNGIVKTAIVNGADSNELLSAMANVYGDLNRRKIEVNMYFNGVYSNTIPNTFATVTYNANGGSMAQGNGSDKLLEEVYIMHFDTTKTIAHTPVPTRFGYVFLGWYLDGELMPNLTAKCAEQTLEALWQPAGLAPADANAKAQQVHYSLSKSKLASTKVYNRPEAKDEYRQIGERISDGTLTVYRDYIAPDGARWAQVNFKGGKVWVMVKAGSNGLPSGGSDAEIDVTVTVTNDYVNSRKNATVHSAQNGTYHRGDKLRIINTASADGYLWGQVAKSAEDDTAIGWVALMYTNWNSVQDGEGSGGSSNTKAIAKATVTQYNYVSMRSGAGTDNKIVGSLAKNETVDVYEIVTVNGHQWGRTNGGWFCLTYADVTMLGNNNNDGQLISNEGALTYVFPASLTRKETPRVSPRDSAEYVQSTHTFKDDDKKEHTVNLLPQLNEHINLLNMVVKGNQTWAKISWRVDLNDNGSDDTTKYGWVKLDANTYHDQETTVSISSFPVQMNPAEFDIVANEVTVREAPSSGAAPIAQNIKLNKGVRIQINAIKLVGENIWGYMTNENVVTGDSDYAAFDGWVNLASKYVKRADMPSIEDDDVITPTGKVGTIVGSDSVNVRITGSTSGKKIGELRRGTTANILEISDNGKWYNLDVDVDKNPETGSWVSAQYVEVKDGTTGGSNGSGSGSKGEPVTTGIGVVANTYSGVKIRSGAGQSYAFVGKLLPGTTVNVLEIKQSGAAKWARIDKGWVCMDYITMLSEEVTYPDGSDDSGKGKPVDSYEEVDRTTTTAVYTGTIAKDTKIYANTEHHGKDEITDDSPSFVVRNAGAGEKITIYELIAVTETHMTNDPDKDSGDDGHGTDVEVTEISYWARVDDGYIWNPQDYINLDALDEQVHTLTGNDYLNIRDTASMTGNKLGKLKQGDQVEVTALKIEKDKVWGRIEYEVDETITGWIRLDYMAEGAVYVEKEPETPTTPPSAPIIGDDGNTGDGGFVDNAGGYRYTGKVINTNQVNVRATPSTGATVTTTLKSGQSLVIYETTTAEAMAWGRCDAGWVYLLYVDMTPCVEGPIDARVVANNVPGVIYTDASCSDTVGTYAGMSVIDVYEYVGKMARTDKGWVSTNDLL